MSKTSAINRADFIRRLVDEGFTVSEATKAYNCMIRTFDDAIVAGARINLGRIGALKPQMQEPRTVHMGFVRKKDEKNSVEVRKSKRVYELGRRLRYKFILFPEFLNKRQLNWF